MAFVMALVSAYCLRQFYREPLRGATVGWRQGQWLLFYQGELRAVELCAGQVCLPWLLRFTLVEPFSRRRYQLYLFSDSAEKAALRRLSRRLTLER